MRNLSLFQSNFNGDIILPGDASYEKESTTFLAKGSPALIVKPHTTSDITQAIRYAQENNLTLSIRSGGHNGAGFGTNTDGMVIDLAHFNTIEVIDEQHHLVRIGAGALWGDVGKTLQKDELALSSGDTLTVGVGGLTLGGGIGWMVRKYGLSIDSLVGAEIVTADGKVLQVSETEHADLFWALRGGGGNFGVVTYFDFVAHPIKKVFAGSIQYPLDKVSDVLKGWRDYMRSAPDELTTMFVILPGMGGNPASVMITCCYSDNNEDAAMEAITPLTKLDQPLHQDIKEKYYFEVLEEGRVPQGVKVVMKNGFVKNFTDELIDAIATKSKSGQMILQIRSVGGAMNRISQSATAFAHRDSEALLVLPTFVPLTASESEEKNLLETWEAMKPFTHGEYCNLLSQRDEDIFNSYPQETYEKLADIKKKYDPENLFNQNYNISPRK